MKESVIRFTAKGTVVDGQPVDFSPIVMGAAIKAFFGMKSGGKK